MTNPYNLKNGDVVTICASGMKKTGTVTYVYYDKDDGGWIIEATDEYFLWKERYDGGRITAVNGRELTWDDDEEATWKEDTQSKTDMLRDAAMARIYLLDDGARADILNYIDMLEDVVFDGGELHE